jgi:hypothetical protein
MYHYKARIYSPMSTAEQNPAGVAE